MFQFFYFKHKESKLVNFPDKIPPGVDFKISHL